uniref:Uncharacterized protein LOC100373867 n=1 Tax=Saccoglossus kowalevskii TaxID=10224 RepID=A0ABM0MD95_SACKO|nr:PREDICTED: uncharacterized protein LOC100373867 [Saccoglossus kowalevskii]
MLLIACMFLLISVAVGQDFIPPPGAATYLGVSYNGLAGNTEGDPLNNGGIDPGLKLTQQVFLLTYNERKTWNGYIMADQVNYNFTDTCTDVNSIEHFWGSESYHENRLTDHSRADKDKNNLENHEFTLSYGYSYYKSQCNDNGFVYYDEKVVCDHGTARYMTENAEDLFYPLTDEFVSAVCALPETYSEIAYMDFLDTWGTDVVTRVSLGIKTTKRYESSRADFVAYVADEYPSTAHYNGFYQGYQDSVRVDMVSSPKHRRSVK